MFWVDSELGSDIYLDGKKCNLIFLCIGILYLKYIRLMFSWRSKGRFQKMFEMYELGFHTARFDHRGVPACFDACLCTWGDVSSC